MSFEIVIVSITAFIAGVVTYFSGFGLATILMPVLLVFFGIEAAIALTAVTHLLNNFLKMVLVGRHTDRETLLRFGIPAVLAAAAGAALLHYLGQLPVTHTSTLFDVTVTRTPLKTSLGVLMILFALFELLPALHRIVLPPKYLSLGGVLSGFFGGLSGHQGAFRTMFLLRSGLSKEQFVATGVAIACVVDLTRLSVYEFNTPIAKLSLNRGALIAAVGSAFLGSILGQSFLHKITGDLLHYLVGALLLAMGSAMILGLI